MRAIPTLKISISGVRGVVGDSLTPALLARFAQAFGTYTGSGTIVVGRIVLIHVDESILRNGKIDYELYHPVGRMGGMEYSRTRDRFTLVRKKYVPES